MVYDNQTRSELQTDQQYPSLGSQKKDLVINPDKAVDSAHPTGTSIGRTVVGPRSNRQPRTHRLKMPAIY